MQINFMTIPKNSRLVLTNKSLLKISTKLNLIKSAHADVIWIKYYSIVIQHYVSQNEIETTRSIFLLETQYDFIICEKSYKSMIAL